jgi:hypothetical protein
MGLTITAIRRGLVLVFVAIFAATPAAYAASSAAVAQGFQADNSRGNIVAGAIVSFKTDSHSVELAASDTADRIAGIAAQSPLLAITGSGPEVQIVLSGSTDVLVSDINGDIKAGDNITASPIAGVGMLATSDGRVVGTAKADFTTSQAQTRTVADTAGGQHQVHVGAVPLQVGLAYYQNQSSSFLPPFLQNLANSIAGRQVSVVRILICLLLLLAALVSLSVLVYSAVRSAMISLGRNPLASANIRKGLYQIGLVTLAVWGGALVASYLILIL